MEWLAAGVPITLLCDLVSTTDPQSASINLTERPPGDLLAVEALVSRAEDARARRVSAG